MTTHTTAKNTETIFNFKTDKKLKAEAKKLADEIGIPLGTVMNSFLKQFVREREITFSTRVYEPTTFLVQALKEADREFKYGQVKTFSSFTVTSTTLGSFSS